MDAARLLGLLRPLLDSVHARWMLAGGFAVAAWGSTRTTADLDLVLSDENRDAVVTALAEKGFSYYFSCEGFTNLSHTDPELGRLDIIWIEGSTAERMFKKAVERTGSDGLPLLVPCVEHLVAMKVRAIQSRPTRALRDGPDLDFLLKLPGIDENLVRGYFEKAGLLELYRRFRGRP
jgi:hypothetical protein